MSPHTRTTFTFLFLDKISNLICAVCPDLSDKDETKVFKFLCAKKMIKLLSDIVEMSLDQNRNVLSHNLEQQTREIYEEIHNQLDKVYGLENKRDSSNADIIRLFRNLHHGASLHGKGFEQLYGAKKGSLPTAFPAIALIIYWALLVNPAKFFDDIAKKVTNSSAC